MSDIKMLEFDDLQLKNDIDWEFMSRKMVLPESVMRQHSDKLYWKEISSYQPMTASFILDFQDRIDFSWLTFNDNVSLTTKLRFAHWYNLNFLLGINLVLLKSIRKRYRKKNSQPRLLPIEEVESFLIMHKLTNN